MELRQLRYFVAVAEELHFGRAARRLFITAPTLSQQFKALERELGTALLTRGQHVELTTAGTVLLSSAREVLRASDEAVQLTRQAAGLTDPRFRLGLLNGAPAWLLLQLQERVRSAVPGVRTVLTGGTTAEQARMLAAGEVDLALLRAPVELPADFACRPIAVEELGILISETDPLAARTVIAPAELDRYELILFPREVSAGLHETLLRELHSRGAAPRLSDSVLGHAQMVSVLPARDDAFGLGSVRARRPGLVWRPLLGDPLVVTYVAAWARSARNPALHALLEQLPGTVLTEPETA